MRGCSLAGPSPCAKSALLSCCIWCCFHTAFSGTVSRAWRSRSVPSRRCSSSCKPPVVPTFACSVERDQPCPPNRLTNFCETSQRLPSDGTPAPLFAELIETASIVPTRADLTESDGGRIAKLGSELAPATDRPAGLRRARIPSARADDAVGSARRIALTIGVLTPASEASVGSYPASMRGAGADAQKDPPRRAAEAALIAAPTANRARHFDSAGMPRASAHGLECSVGRRALACRIVPPTSH